MGNEVVNEGKDCCKEAKGQESGVSFLSVLSEAGKGIASAVHKAEDVGSGLISGAAKGLGIPIQKETADAISRGVVTGAIGGAGIIIGEQAIKHPGATAAAVGAGVVGAAAAEVLKGVAKDGGKDTGCAAECAKDMAKDAAIGAAIGGVAGAAGGDATRAVTLAALGAVTGCAARCAAEMCKPCCGVKPVNPIDAAKEVGKTTLDHIKNRPIEAAGEAIIGGVPAVVGGALLHKVMDNKDCEKLCDRVMKNTCNEIKRQADAVKNWIVNPFQPQHLK